jgi:trans-aconitate 2-methyltransferase
LLLDGPSPGNPVAWDADDYARNSRMQEEYARKHLAQLELGGGETVLDIGCGDGRITAEIAQRVPRGRVIGIDSSPEMIATACRTQQPYRGNLSFEVMDATALSFPPQFDLVFSTSALHWVKDHVAVLEGINRALKPVGKMYLTFGAKGTLSGLAPVMAALMENPRWKACFENFEVPFGFYGPAEYRVWLDRLGFIVDRLELIERDVTHQGRELFEGWLRTTGMPYIHRVEPGRRPEFLRQIIDDYLAQNPIDAQGLIHVRMVNLLVQATKN